jgi:hypothetical protein
MILAMDIADALFPTLLGHVAWQSLPEPVQRMHGATTRVTAYGEADVEGDNNVIVRALRRLLGLPSPGLRQTLAFVIERSGGGETWTRRFAQGEMRSVLKCNADATELLERLGPVTLHFSLRHDASGIDWHLRSVRAFGLPLPRAWAGEVQSRSSAMNGRYAFAIDTRLPLAGRLVAYRGWLEIVPDA